MSNRIDVLYNKKISFSRNGNYYAIPVYPIKILITYYENYSLDHFERAILSLLYSKYYTNKEIADLLMLNYELIDYIIYNLETKGLLNKNKLTQEGEYALSEVFGKKETTDAYCFYDVNRDCIIPNICKFSDLGIAPRDEYMNKFIYISDDYDTNVMYKYIKLNKERNIRVNQADIINKLSRLVLKTSDKNLLKVELVTFEQKIYHLLGCIGNEIEGQNFNVLNPISLHNDEDLYKFFIENTDNSAISSLIVRAADIQKRMSGNDEDIFDEIKKSAFNREIRDIHVSFIPHLIKIFKLKFASKNNNYAQFLENKDNIKNAMISMGDLFETILYQAAFEAKQPDSCFDILMKDRKENQYCLSKIAKEIGITIDEDCGKLLSVRKKEVSNLPLKPMSKNLSNCLAWNLLIAKNSDDYFLNKLSKKYPNLLSLLYIHKRNYRDLNRHSIEVDRKSGDIFFDLLFDMLKEAFGYELNEARTMKIFESSKSSDSNKYYEFIRVMLGTKFMISQNERIVKIKINLINMYKDFMENNSDFSNKAYSIFDSILKDMLTYYLNTNDFKINRVRDRFETNDEIINYLKSLNFNLTPYPGIDTNFKQFIDKFDDNIVQKNFTDGFENSVLRTEILSLILMMSQDEGIEYQIKSYRNIFIYTASLSKIMGHQQKQEFNIDESNIMVKETLEFVKFIYKKLKLYE